MKTYRLYYNYRSTAPVVWALDEGTQASEIHVQRIDVAPGCGITSHFSTDHVEGAPSAWFELTADCEIKGGVAYFTRAEGLMPADTASSFTTPPVEIRKQRVA
jgi:hypothetical protein